ncbi:hypothetical protein ACAG26_24375 [Mycobacterium sp. pUA109]|uniref:hypothetical protein n=1 Tax=Mycobacterium sp. pUA109 TaxID=3238982 RepID=UPI00351B153E
MADDDEVYVDVIPKLDEAAADEAVGTLREKFKDVTGSFSDGLRDSMGDAFHDLGGRARDWGNDLAGQLGESFGTHLGQGDLGGIFGDFKDIVGSSFDPFRDITDHFGDRFRDIGDIFGEFKGGDIFGGLDHLSDTLKSIGGGEFGNVTGALDNLSGALKGFGGIADELSGLKFPMSMNDAKSSLESLAHLFGQGSDVANLLGQGNSRLGKAAQLAQGGANFIDQMNQPDEGLTFGDEIGRILSGAGGGAGMGAVFGPPGAAVGGALGSLAMVGHDWYDWANRMAAAPPQPTYDIPDWAPPRLGSRDMASYFLNAPLHATPGMSAGGSPWIPGAMPMPSTSAAPSSITTSTMGVTAGTVNITGGISIPGLSAASAPMPGSLGTMPGVGHGGTTPPHATAAAPHAPAAPSAGGNANGHLIGLPPGLQHHFDGGIIGHFDEGGTVPGGSSSGHGGGRFNPNIQIDLSQSGWGELPPGTATGMPPQIGLDSGAPQIDMHRDVRIPQGNRQLTAPGPVRLPPIRPGANIHAPGDVYTGSDAHPENDEEGVDGANLGHFSDGGILPGSSPGYDNMLGFLPDGSAVGLEGGEGVINPGAMSQPGVADLVRQLNGHYDDGGQIPGLVAPPTQGNEGGPIQSKGLGSGSGAGISGGGLIGLGESAAATAAGAFSFGGGAIAAQMAEQEMNLAAQKGAQAAATAVAAPFETLWLGGGMMGAPSLSSPMFGWPGKILGGLIGQQFNAPNIAGATQPPKDPKEPTEEEEPGIGTQNAPSSPSGAKDDPMHVKVTNPANGTAPLGATTSALSGVGSMFGLGG